MWTRTWNRASRWRRSSWRHCLEADRLRAPGLLGFVAAGCLAVGCDEAPEPPPPVSEVPSPASHPFPVALQVRFHETRGSGLSGESWEVEILHLADEVRVRGSVRTASATIPIYHPMSVTEYAEFWNWLRGFPWQGFRAREDPDAPRASWRKELQIDIVLGEDERIRCGGEWERPLLEPPWIGAIENGLHMMVLDYAEAELERMRAETPDGGEEADEAMRRAMEALGLGEETNLPGGSPRVD